MLLTFYMFGNLYNKMLEKTKEKRKPKQELKHFWKNPDQENIARYQEKYKDMLINAV